MKNVVLFSFLFACTLLFLSCEGGTTYSKIVQNQSSETITIDIKTPFGGQQSFTIAPSQEATIYWDDRMGNFAGENYQCIDEIESLDLTISNDKMLLKNMLDDSNWINDSHGGRNATETCTFEILDTDLN